MMKRLISALTLLCTIALPVAAEDRFETPVKGEIISGWQRSDGTQMAGIRLRLTPGWKTYWRSPGDAGIPPQFDWSGSDNLRAIGITWPTPKLFLTAGMQTIGYSGDLVLPINLVPHTPGKPITVNVHLDIGVCSDICVPHQMQLKAVIDTANTKPTGAIAAALAARPLSASEAGVDAAKCALVPSADGLGIEATLQMPSTGTGEVVVIEPGHPDLWISETQSSRNGRTLRAVGEIIANGSAAAAIDRSKIRITVLGSKHTVDIQGCTPG